MTTEDRLRDLLQTEAAQVDSTTEWTDVERSLAARRRTRRLRQAALSTVAAAAMVAGVLAVVSDNDRESGLRVVPPATQPTIATTLPPPPTTGDVATLAYPPTVVVLRGDGTIAELSSADGRQLRVLLPAFMPSRGTLSMPDARDVVYTERDGRVLQIALKGGTKRDLGAGWSPAISPDGTRLAFVVDSGRAVGERGTWNQDRLVVRDLRSGRERTWDEPMPEPPVPPDVISRLSWSADSRRLVIEHGWEDGLDLAVFDTSEAELTPSMIEQVRTVYGSPVYLGDSLVVLANDDAGNPNEAAPDRIVTVDPATGRVTSTLVQGIFGRPLAADASGHHLLYVRTGDGTSELHRLTDGRSVKIADDVFAADW